MFKKALLAVALTALASGASLAQSTAPPMVPGNYQTAPQTNCTVGPCWVPFSATNPLPVTPVSGGTDQDVNLVGINGVAPVTGSGTATGALRVELPTNGTGVIATVGAVTTITNPLVQSIGITPTDRTITSATGASQQVMAANASRHSLLIQNTGSSNCGINPTGGTAAIGGAGTLTLTPGGSYSPRIPTLSAVTAICTAAQPLYANEN